MNFSAETELINLAKTHYENFPVGSFLIPSRYRKPIHLIYTFARVADDIADEGNAPESVRLQKLDEWENLLSEAVAGKSSDRFFRELADAIQQWNLSVQLLSDLLIAFRMDVLATRYKTFDDVLKYCSYSANPIGRLLLHIFNSASNENVELSDSICTALQLANFWQDISVDIHKNRFYICTDEAEKFSVSEEDFRLQRKKEECLKLLQFQIERTRALFEQGKPLVHLVNKNFQFELKMIWQGGVRILEKTILLGESVLYTRPRLSVVDKVIVCYRAIKM